MDDPPFTLCQNQIVLLPRNTPHIYYASEKDPWSLFWVHIRGRLLESIWNRGSLSRPRYLPLQTCLLLERLFEECFGIFKRTYTDDDYFYASTLLTHVFGLAVSSASDDIPSEKCEHLVLQITDYMKRTLSRSLTMDELSDTFHYSQSYINQLFKRYRQCTPMHYFLQMKIQNASKELYFSQASIKEIALKYGFTDPLYFSRLFQKTFGISPTEYRHRQPG